MKTIGLLLLLLGLAAGAWAGDVGDAVQVQIRSENGRTLPFYPVEARHPNRRVYAEAVKGDHYTIVVHNRLNRRVGIVVAVDGRNIISGQKSWLKNSERMYILEPYATGEYNGWRTDLDRVNRFYFTSAADSYAAAFNDESAMGVIAVAVYPEVRHEPVALAAPAAPHAAKKAKSADRAGSGVMYEERAGTGYGREEYSPSYVVAFEAEEHAVERIFIKYEWRSTLTRLGIIPAYRPERNRLWDNGGFAPPPPGRG
ncbi:MAG TPA: hypothetical protein VI389_09875 [Geobacteraceae bacterium]